MNNQIAVIAPKASINGVPQDIWADRWYQWNNPLPDDKNPADFDDSSDPKGRLGSLEKAQEGQDDDVFYLVGSFSEGEEFDIPERTIIVPGDKKVFLPIVNVSWIWGFENGFFENLDGYPTSEGSLTPDEIRIINTAIINAVKDPYLRLDGEFINDGFPEAFRQESPADSDNDGIAGFSSIKDGNEIAEVAEGYWVGLEPLPSGEHTIEFGGIIILGDLEIDLDGNGSVDEGKEEFLTGVLQGFGTLQLDVSYNILNLIEGCNFQDNLKGTAGNDYLKGKNDEDNLLGLEGNDLIVGGKGKDFIDGGSGDDELWGDNDQDTFKYQIGYGQDTIFDLEPGEIIEIRGFTDAPTIEKTILASGIEATVITFNSDDMLTLVDVEVTNISINLNEGTIEFNS